MKGRHDKDGKNQMISFPAVNICSNFLQLFNSLEDYDVLVNQVPMWETRLSTLLGDMQIVFDEESPLVSVVEYLNYLYRVVSSLKRALLTPDASVYIKPGEFENFTARILRYVSASFLPLMLWGLKSLAYIFLQGLKMFINESNYSFVCQHFFIKLLSPWH